MEIHVYFLLAQEVEALKLCWLQIFSFSEFKENWDLQAEPQLSLPKALANFIIVHLAWFTS